jgi:hypothetical protein
MPSYIFLFKKCYRVKAFINNHLTFLKNKINFSIVRTSPITLNRKEE